MNQNRRGVSTYMNITIPGKVVVFDYGEVISAVPTLQDRAELLNLAKADPGPFWEAYWRHRKALDQWTVDTWGYWTLIQQELGVEWEPERLHRLWLTDLRGWMRINPDVLDVLISLQLGGTRMALLSNAGRDYASYFRYGMLGSFFDQVFVSGELDALKPSPEIFHAVLASLDVSPADVIFIDDREENVVGAGNLGIQGHVFTTAAELRSYLVGLTSPAEVDGLVAAEHSPGGSA